MLRFAVRRTIGMATVLFAISVIVFLIFNVIPNSDPAARIAGKNANPALIARVRADLGLDQSLPVQYLTMMKQIFTGQLTSYSSDQNVAQQILKGLPVTLSLTIGAAVLWMVLAVWFGYLSAVRAGRFTDRALTILALVGISLPVFWLAAILLYYLSFKAQMFPTGSYVPLSEDPLQWAYHLILPWLTLAVLYVGFYSRLLRSNMLDAMNEDYVRTARAKGAPEWLVMRSHILRNALLPIVTMLGMDIALGLGGAVFTEAVYNLPGLGQWAVQSLETFDLPVTMGVVVFSTTAVLVVNLVIDIVYAFIDPRIKLA